MKKAALLLALVLMLAAFAGCGKDGDTSSDSLKDGTVQDAPSKNGADEGDLPEYTDGVVPELYIPMLCTTFYSEYNAGDDISKKDIFHLTAGFILTQRPDSTVTSPENGEIFGVTASQLEGYARLLFGDSIAISDYTKFMDPELGDSYDSATDTYYFDKMQTSAPIGDGYYLSFDDEMDVKDTGAQIVARVTVCDPRGQKQELTYTFDKVIFEEYLYVRLVKVAR